MAGGEVRMEISEVLPLTEVQRAHELSEAGHTRSKIVLTVSNAAAMPRGPRMVSIGRTNARGPR